jgi:hypothetical protein
MDLVETRLRAALLLYQDAATDTCIAYYVAAGFSALLPLSLLDMAATEIRDALAAYLADGTDPLETLLLDETHEDLTAEDLVWLRVVAADLRARLAGEDRPVPTPGEEPAPALPREQMQ